MKNFHVFEVDHRKSLCGQVERKSPTSEREYCGQCIGTFFADDDY